MSYIYMSDIGGRDCSQPGDLFGYGGPDILTGRDGCEETGLRERGEKFSLNPCCLEKNRFSKLGVSAPMASGCQRTAGAL